jgi:hypothetical protein
MGKVAPSDDSNDSARLMIVDEIEEVSNITDDSTVKMKSSTEIVPNSNLTTITSLVEQEICKTLGEKEKISNNHGARTNRDLSMATIDHSTLPPPLLVIPVRAHSPATTEYSYGNQATVSSAKGSIMHGTPISPSTATNKSVVLDATTVHSSLHPSARNEPVSIKSQKMIDRNSDKQHLFHHHHHHHQPQQHGTYAFPYNQQPASSGQYLSQQHKSSSNKIDASNTLETLHTDYLTSKYLTSTHSPNQER